MPKINVTLASGDLPDVTPVNATQLKQLADSDQIEDITELYEKYASVFTKKVLSGEGTSIFDAATFDGKLMAIPSLESSIERSMYIWIRTDWLDTMPIRIFRWMTARQTLGWSMASNGTPFGCFSSTGTMTPQEYRADVQSS